MIDRRVEVIANTTESADLIDRIQQEVDFVAPQLLEALQDAQAHGAPSPTFIHEGVEYTVYAAQLLYSARGAKPQTVLGAERKIPEARLHAGNSRAFRRKLLLLQRPEPRPRKLKGFHKPYCLWDASLCAVSTNELENTEQAPDGLLTAFAQNAEGIFDQLVTKSREKIESAEHGLRALTSLQERIS